MDNKGAMDGCGDAMYIDERLDPDCSITDQLIGMAVKVLPRWRAGETTCKKLSGGQINCIWRCSNSLDNKDIILRINPAQERLPKVDRKQEFKAMMVLSERGLISPVFAKFTNGIVYQYVEGESLTSDQLMFDSHIKHLVLRGLHRMMGIPLSEISSSSPHSVQDNIWWHYCNLLISTTYPQPEHQDTFDREIRPVLEEEREYCCDVLKKLFHRYPHVFCHNDVWKSNLIYTPQDEVAFIDWEAAGVGIEPLELSVLLTWTFGCESVDEATEERLQKEWIRSYLERRPVDPEIGEPHTEGTEKKAGAKTEGTASNLKTRQVDPEIGQPDTEDKDQKAKAEIEGQAAKEKTEGPAAKEKTEGPAAKEKTEGPAAKGDDDTDRGRREITDATIDRWYKDIHRLSAIVCFGAAMWSFWIVTLTTDPEQCGEQFKKGYKDFQRFLRYKQSLQKKLT